MFIGREQKLDSMNQLYRQDKLQLVRNMSVINIMLNIGNIKTKKRIDRKIRQCLNKGVKRI